MQQMSDETPTGCMGGVSKLRIKLQKIVNSWHRRRAQRVDQKNRLRLMTETDEQTDEQTDEADGD